MTARIPKTEGQRRFGNAPVGTPIPASRRRRLTARERRAAEAAEQVRIDRELAGLKADFERRSAARRTA